jgi:hypothetical protein
MSLYPLMIVRPAEWRSSVPSAVHKIAFRIRISKLVSGLLQRYNNLPLSKTAYNAASGYHPSHPFRCLHLLWTFAKLCVMRINNEVGET